MRKNLIKAKKIKKYIKHTIKEFFTFGLFSGITTIPSRQRLEEQKNNCRVESLGESLTQKILAEWIAYFI